MKILVASVLLVSGFASWTHAQGALTYQKPPAAIEDLLDAPLTPRVVPSPDRFHAAGAAAANVPHHCGGGTAALSAGGNSL